MQKIRRRTHTHTCTLDQYASLCIDIERLTDTNVVTPFLLLIKIGVFSLVMAEDTFNFIQFDSK